MSNLSFTQEIALELYNSEDKFPVDFDDAWVWLGYSTKQMAEKKLKANFEPDIDFLTKGLKSPSEGRPSQWIALTIDCFKSLALAGETVILWWGLFDNELYVERDNQRFGPFYPVDGPIPLHRYRKHKKTKTEEGFRDFLHRPSSCAFVPLFRWL